MAFEVLEWSLWGLLGLFHARNYLIRFGLRCGCVSVEGRRRDVTSTRIEGDT